MGFRFRRGVGYSIPAAPPRRVLPIDAPATPTPRRLAQWAVLGLSGFLLIRTAGVEPFGVPTGSMALTLLGNHREGFCPRCDERVCVGVPPPGARPVRFDRVTCPNCGEPVDLTAAREIPGDRLLVDKTAYLVRPPRRWEVAVFLCAADGGKPYVKRVVGLPGERIRLSRGDVFADDRLLRKTHAEARELAVPVFDFHHAPPEGWASRFAAESLGGGPVPTSVVTTQGLRLDGRGNSGVGVSYRQRDLSDPKDEPVTDAVAYNGPAAERFAADRGVPVRDFVAEFTLSIDPASAPGQFACRLADGTTSVRADLSVGEVSGVRVSVDGGALNALAAGPGLTPGRDYRVAFAFVDRRATLSIDGREVTDPLDLPADESRPGGVARPVQFGVRGASVAVRDLKISRDVHYLSPSVGAAWALGGGEFFVLGDNTHDSHDSRAWVDAEGRPAPGVPAGAFLGKPFLVHQPLRLSRLPGGAAVPSPDWARLRFLR